VTGIYNTEFWIDPSRGIGGVMLIQLLPLLRGIQAICLDPSGYKEFVADAQATFEAALRKQQSPSNP
jgi:hypothetical protein